MKHAVLFAIAAVVCAPPAIAGECTGAAPYITPDQVKVFDVPNAHMAKACGLYDEPGIAECAGKVQGVYLIYLNATLGAQRAANLAWAKAHLPANDCSDWQNEALRSHRPL